jgi:hypothetical protein
VKEVGIDPLWRISIQDLPRRTERTYGGIPLIILTFMSQRRLERTALEEVQQQVTHFTSSNSLTVTVKPQMHGDAEARRRNMNRINFQGDSTRDAAAKAWFGVVVQAGGTGMVRHLICGDGEFQQVQPFSIWSG